ncbi:MAG: YbdK family carboxylate-amine ligase [Gemmataceae bacterium]
MKAALTETKLHPQIPPLEDFSFVGSPDTTLGVELELQIIDPDSGDLVPGALRILDACAEENIEGVSGEFLLSMLEIKTAVCGNVAEVKDALVRTFSQVRNIAYSLGYDLAIGGTHPFARPCTSAISPEDRYQRLRKEQGWLAYQEAIFGLHVHVGVPGALEAIGVANLIVEYLPHLLALSANSSFWEGVDTSFASVRARMFRPSAQSGIPPHFSNWEEFCRYCKLMHAGRALASTKDLYWDVRPRPHLGTLEFRIFDAPASLSTLLGLTALARCLVIEGLRLLKEQPDQLAGDPSRYLLANENKWLAARYGLQAPCVRRPGEECRTLAEDTDQLLDRLEPVAREAGEATFLDAFQPLDQFELGADRQRRLYRQTGNWHAVVADMRDRWLQEIHETAPAGLITRPNSSERNQSALHDRRPSVDGHLKRQECDRAAVRTGPATANWGQSTVPGHNLR